MEADNSKRTVQLYNAQKRKRAKLCQEEAKAPPHITSPTQGKEGQKEGKEGETATWGFSGPSGHRCGHGLQGVCDPASEQKDVWLCWVGRRGEPAHAKGSKCEGVIEDSKRVDQQLQSPGAHSKLTHACKLIYTQTHNTQTHTLTQAHTQQAHEPGRWIM